MGGVRPYRKRRSSCWVRARIFGHHAVRRQSSLARRRTRARVAPVIRDITVGYSTTRMRKSLLSLTRETLSPVAPPSTVGGMDAKSTASNVMGGYFIRQSVRQECAADTSATSCAPVRHSIVPREMFLPPMLGDVAPGAKPHSVAPACKFEKLDQPSRPGGTPDETIDED